MVVIEHEWPSAVNAIQDSLIVSTRSKQKSNHRSDNWPSRRISIDNGSSRSKYTFCCLLSLEKKWTAQVVDEILYILTTELYELLPLATLDFSY